MLYDPKWKPPAKPKKAKVKERPIRAKGLKDDEIKYLLKVLALLKEGKIVSRWDWADKNSMTFNMGRIAARSTNPEYTGFCGTVGCIGGWMMMLKRMDDGVPLSKAFHVDGSQWWVMSRQVLFPLFYPAGYVMALAEPEDGIRAIENYLFRGWQKNPWKFMDKKVSSKPLF